MLDSGRYPAVLGSLAALLLDDDSVLADRVIQDSVAALRYAAENGDAAFIITSSVSAAETSAPSAYGAIKAALIHYAKGLSRQLVGKGIRVNCVSPGNTYFEGGIWQNIEKNMPDLFQSTLKVNPTGKFGTAEEVANGVVFISSPMASRISGTNLVIDGALTVAV